MATAATMWKRILLGRQIASDKAEHQLLPKTLALPVFSSDPLSSVAYATEEMMLVLAVAGAAALRLMLPIAAVIAVVLAIVITSYRQTVRAYPRGGGSYIVARENLGTIPGLAAASAILTDYVLTVAVSVTAGTVAVISAAPDVARYRVGIALAFIGLITIANLRGVREAGTLFAVPTYGFVACVLAMLITGLVRCLGGCPVAASASAPLEPGHGLTLFLVLKAFSSGSTALTGVEAIADGVQAFRRPQSKNAATTLAVMGGISITMFLGITVLARRLQVHVSEELHGVKSVLAQVGETVFAGGAMFYVLQIFTAAILFLAANTAYQDFPRLSAILARDRFMPSQFKNRGDRLVFSNGVLVLAMLAGLLVWAFDASLTSLIQLYVVGVFTAFTLSQSGMVRRWLRTREGRWRRSAVINAIGASATGVVLVIVAVTKFGRPPKPGAWIVLTAMPIIIGGLLSVKRHYESVRVQLRTGRVRAGETGPNRVVFVLTDIDAAAAEALGYIRSFRPEELHPVYVGRRPREEVALLWGAIAGTTPPLRFLDGRDRVGAVLEYVRGVASASDGFVTVVIPELFRKRSLLHAMRRPVTFRLKVRLLREPRVVITDVPVLVQGDRLVGVDARPLIPERMVAMVFVSSLHDATIRAVNYAASLHAVDTRAVYFALDEEESAEVVREWSEREVPMRLDIVDAPFRDLGPPILREVRRTMRDGRTVAAVIIPELVVRRWRHRLLHNVNSLFVKRLLLFEPRVILSSVPFQLK